MKMKHNGLKANLKTFLKKYNVVLVLLIMLVFASVATDKFFTTQNIFNLFRQISALGVVSMGMLLVILTGGIDLSVGSIMALISVLFALMMQSMSIIPATLLSLGIGTAVGSIAGLLVSVFNMAPFVATLSMMTIARGFALVFSNGSPIMITDKALDAFAQGYFLYIPFPVFVMLIVFGICFFLLRKSVFGRMIIAVGSNEEAVKLSGVRVKKYKFMVYAISGLFCSIGGMISTTRTSVGSPIIAEGFELDAIASVVIGGASLSGGKGLALNTLIGAFILGMIANVMNLMNIPGYNQNIVKGIIIVIAVISQNMRLLRGFKFANKVQETKSLS